MTRDRISICIETILPDHAMSEKIEIVAAEGIHAVEIWSWRDKNRSDLHAVLDATGSRLIAINMEPFGNVLDGGGIKELRDAVKESCEFAADFRCPVVTVHLQPVSDEPGPAWYESLMVTGGFARYTEREKSLTEGYAVAAEVASDYDCTLLIEPLNCNKDHSGYFLNRSQQAFRIARGIGSDSIGVLFDFYHQQITEGNLISNFTEGMDVIRHIHMADAPGRHEPGTGEINYQAVLRAIGASAYSGSIGLEYFPSKPNRLMLESFWRYAEDL